MSRQGEQFAKYAGHNGGDKRSAALIKNTNSWPAWPFLPMVNKRRPGSSKMGILRAGQSPYTVYVGVNLYTTIRDFEKAEKQTFSSVEAMLDAGWEVY